MLHLIEHTLQDTWILLPILFLTYYAMEYLEHRAEEKSKRLIQKAGVMGPVFGSVLGVVPQCGFSAAASNLYAGRIITMGTLLAIFLSTSDEMLPIMISRNVPPKDILGILLLKVGIGMFAGVVLDTLLRGKQGRVHILSQREAQEYTGEPSQIRDLCEQESCHCGESKSIFRSALFHTIRIFLFVVVVTFALNAILAFVGEESLETLILNHKIWGPMISALVGLIPNCAGSVLITSLYLEGAMGLGATLAGLLASSGVGLLVLFRMNRPRRENFAILGILYGISVLAGILIGLL